MRSNFDNIEMRHGDTGPGLESEQRGERAHRQILNTAVYGGLLAMGRVRRNKLQQALASLMCENENGAIQSEKVGVVLRGD